MKYLGTILLLLFVLASVLSYGLTQAPEGQEEDSFDEYEARNIVSMLASGGYTIYVRHTTTDRSRSDTGATCDQQRLLSAQGREEAKLIGAAARQMQLPVGRLISTEYCRTKETTELSFGHDYEIVDRGALMQELGRLFATPPAAGTNNIIVAHVGTLEQGISIRTGGNIPFNEGDSIIFKPIAGGSYEVAGFIDVLDWQKLAELRVYGRLLAGQ